MNNRALNTFRHGKHPYPRTQIPSKHVLYLVLSVILCYVSLLSTLNHLNGSADWSRIKHPHGISLDSSFTVSVKFKDIMQTAQLSVSAMLRDHNNRYLYRIRPQIPVCRIIGTSKKIFQFSIPTDPRITSIQFCAEYQDLPAERSMPLPNASDLRKPVFSDRIPVYANALEIPRGKTHSMALGDIFRKALNNGHWREHAGDYTPIGWFVTGLYLLGAGICMICIIKSRQHSPTCTRFWWMCVLALLLLGINKQLDLQMLLADLGRTYAKSRAWYTMRKPVQIQAVSIVLALCLGLVEIILFKLRQQPKITWLALFGLTILALYFGLRMVSLHHVDKLIMGSYGGLAMGSLIEVAGILCINASALIELLKSRRPRVQYILR